VALAPPWSEMKETIYTIPINEAFDRFDGCPMCVLNNDLERSSLDYIMGAAMMEPDIRIKTNEQGFCHRHLQKMLVEKNKLSLALMIESHLPELGSSLFLRAGKVAGKDTELKKAREAARRAELGCYVCTRVSEFMAHYYNNVIYLWRKEPGFRDRFNSQPFFCLPHYSDLLAHSERGLPRKEQAEFISGLSAVCQSYLVTVNSDISEFCRSFDYRNAGKVLTESAQTAVERATAFLTGTK